MNSLKKILAKSQEKTVLVIGDSILDVSVYCKALGLSLETPTIKAKKIKAETTMGGASNIVKNCLALGVRCHFITVLGEDGLYKEYEKWQDENLAISAIIEERENISKTRYWIQREDQNYKYLQLNTGDRDPISKESQECILQLVEEIVDSFDVVLLIDYQNGIFSSKKFVKNLIKTINEKNKLVICNSQKSTNKARQSWFAGTDLISMNQEEALANDKDFSLEEKSLENLQKSLQSGVCVTLGDKGSVIRGVDHDEDHSCDALKIDSENICGAGDAFLSCLSILDWKKYPLEALAISNTWAALSINKLEMTCPNREELIELVKVLDNEQSKKSDSTGK